MIQRITDAYVRTYSDTGHATAYVEWVDRKGRPGRTEGSPQNLHVQAIMARAARESRPVRLETW